VPVGLRNPGALPNVLARVEAARGVLNRADPEVRTVVEGLLSFAMTQHELNRRLWDMARSLPVPHASEHVFGDDQIGGNLGDGNLVGINVKATGVDYTFESKVWLVRADASGGDVTVTLPPVTDRPGRLVAVAKVDDSVNLVTVAASGGDTLAGDASFDLRRESEVLSLISDDVSGDWAVV
jgi:hypothetical protein